MPADAAGAVAPGRTDLQALARLPLRTLVWQGFAGAAATRVLGGAGVDGGALETGGAEFVEATRLLAEVLPGFVRLETLGVEAGGAFGDEHVEALLRTKVRSLRLDDTAVTGAGLRRLAELPSLQELAFGGLVDSSLLEALCQLQQLESLTVEPAIGLEAYGRLWQALPGCRIGRISGELEADPGRGGAGDGWRELRAPDERR